MTTIDSLLSEPVGSLLIEGGPGTGKTTFAIELLRKAGHGIYISTRVSKEKLLEQIPGVKELIVRDEDGGGQSAPIKMEDSRLATAVRVVQYLVQLEKRAETRLIVLDSWDAIASEIPSVERLKTEKSLLVIAEARNSKLAFISEESQQTSLNYLVDAVVELKRELHDGAVVRTLELKKLRGSPILNPNALFTLFGARFREFEPVPPHPVRFVKMEDFQPIKHDANFFSTGLRDLDERYSGGFRRGSVNLLEFGENLNPSVHNGSYNIIASNFIMNGGCALVVPGGGQDLRDLVVLANASMPAEAVLNGLAVGAFERYPDPCFFDLSPTSIEDCFDVLWGRMESLNGIISFPARCSWAADLTNTTGGGRMR